MLLREVQFVAVRGLEDLAQEVLRDGVVAAADYARQVGVYLVFELGVAGEELLEDFVGLRLLPRQVLDYAFDGDLPPPHFLAFEAVVQQHCVALLAGLGESFLLGLGLETGAVEDFVHVPGRVVVIDYVVDDG